MEAVILPIIGLLINTSLLIIFNIKKHIKSEETKIYSKMLGFSTAFIIIGLIAFAVGKITNNIEMIGIIQKVYMGILILLNHYSVFYCVSIFEPEFFNKYFVKNVFYAIPIVFVSLVAALPLNVIFYDNVLDGDGPSYNVAIVYVILCFAAILFLTIVSLLKKKSIKKIIPFLILVAFYVIGFFIRNQYRELIFEGFFYSYILFIMFFTIENPDLKMLEQVEIAKQQADRANQAKTDFLSNMSHEIRTPLNAIVGFSQALSEEDCLNEQAHDEVKDIMMASENLLEIVNGILDISKIESGKLEIIAKDYSFKKVWEEIVALGRGRLGDKPLDFRTFYDESIPEVLYGDSTRIKEVVVNLLTNAIKYTKEGYVELKVSSIIKDDVCRLIISVEDSGIGIKQENIEKLFSKFERFGVEKEITIEGTGLGLAITKKLVDLMNGTIVVQSVYGKGSKFTVSIDQKIQVGHHIEDTTQSLNLEELITADLSGKRVLVVDDNMVNLKVAARLLKDYNLIIDEVDSGEECINKVMSDVKYDLILMDDMMPKMSGTDTFHHLQELDGFNIPTIALTANAISGMKEKYLGEGFNDYLAKPIDRKELNKIIKKFLVENKNE